VAIAADSRDRVAGSPPAEGAWTAGALIGVALGVGLVALVFAPPLAALIVLVLALGGITMSLSGGVRPPGVGRLAAAVPAAGRDALHMGRAVVRGTGALTQSLSRLMTPAVGESAPAPAAEPVAAAAAPIVAPSVVPTVARVTPPPVAAELEQPTIEMPAITPAAAPPAPAAHVEPLAEAVGADTRRYATAIRPDDPDRPDAAAAAEELFAQARHLETEGDTAAAEKALAHAAAGGHRLAAMHLAELCQRTGDTGAAMDAYRLAAAGDDSLATAAALSLGVLLEAHGDVSGAEAAYRKAAAGETSASESASMLLSWLTRRREHAAI